MFFNNEICLKDSRLIHNASSICIFNWQCKLNVQRDLRVFWDPSLPSSYLWPSKQVQCKLNSHGTLVANFFWDSNKPYHDALGYKQFRFWLPILILNSTWKCWVLWFGKFSKGLVSFVTVWAQDLRSTVLLDFLFLKEISISLKKKKRHVWVALFGTCLGHVWKLVFLPLRHFYDAGPQNHVVFRAPGPSSVLWKWLPGHTTPSLGPGLPQNAWCLGHARSKEGDHVMQRSLLEHRRPSCSPENSMIFWWKDKECNLLLSSFPPPIFTVVSAIYGFVIFTRWG